MKVLLAPDKFKGSLGAGEVAATLARAWREFAPGVELALAPITDGGEGFVENMVTATGGRLHRARTVDAAGRPCVARWGVLGDKRTAVLDIAEASGLARLPEELRSAGLRDTCGTGRLMERAVRSGCEKLIMGLGGSATNDGGIGLAASLGFQFLDRFGKSIPLHGFGLAQLARIVPPEERPRLQVVAATDVTNPLFGRDGAAYRYAAQKGATAAEIRELDQNLRRLARVVARCLGRSPHDEAGAGAAGGAGYGLMAFFAATRAPGFGLFAETAGLERQIQWADLIVTGEGRMDATSEFGKGCFALAELAAKHQRPIWAVCGQIDADGKNLPFTKVASLVSAEVSPAQALRFPRRYLRLRLREMME